MYGKATLIGFAGLIIAAFASAGVGQDKAPQSPLDAKAQFILSGMRSERGKLRSGVCSVTGTVSRLQPAKPEFDLRGPVKILFAFDDSGNQRIDRTEPGWVSDAKTGSGRKKKGTVSAKSCRTSKKYAYWIEGNESVTLTSPNTVVANELLNWLDPRAIGMAGPMDLPRQVGFNEIMERMTKNAPPAVDDSGEDWILTREFNTQRISQWRHWVRPREGVTPVRVEQRYKKKPSDTEWTIGQTVETKWRSTQDVWVPVYQAMSLFTDTGMVYSHEYEMSWSKINESIDPEVFSYESFNAPKELGLTDSSPGKPLVIKLPEFAVGNEKSTMWLWWVLGGLVTVVGVTMFIKVRRRT